MGLIAAGLALWIITHMFKRLAPTARAGLTERFGEASKGIVAGLIVLSVILMVIGYRGADLNPVYQLPGWAFHVNNLLMLIAVILFGMGSSKGRARSWLRHPMLTGVVVWAVAHLLVNSDTASLLLFGGLGLWSIASMFLINAAEGPWARPEPGPVSGDVKLVVISLFVFAVIAAIHTYIGPAPFMRS